MSDATQVAALGLSNFLTAYRLARAPGAGLKHFLTEYRQLRAGVPQSKRAALLSLDPAGFAAFLHALHGACAAGRATDRITNIWSIAGLKRNEVRTTAVLAWALDHRQDHGFGDLIMQSLIEAVKNFIPNDLRLGRNYYVRTEYCVFGARDDRIDIAIEGENCIIFIEAKIDAPEGPRQIERYLKKARSRATYAKRNISCVFYLSETMPVDHVQGVIPIRWGDVANAIETAVKLKGQPNSFSSQVLRHFASHVRKLHGGRFVATGTR